MHDPGAETGSAAPLLDAALSRVADRYAPVVAPPFGELVARRRRRTAWRTAAGAGAVALAVTAVLVGPALLSSAPVEREPAATGGPAGPPVDEPGIEPATPLVKDGECAGLTATAQWQGPGGEVVPIEPLPAENTVSMPANSLLYLEASGTCVYRLLFSTESSLVQGTSSMGGGRFSAGVAPIISHPGGGGSAVLELHLACRGAQECPQAVLARLTIDITPSDPVPTETPWADEPQPASWTLAATPEPADTIVALQVHELACASGQSAEGRISAEVEYTDTTVVVRVDVARVAGFADCQANPLTPYNLELTEPVGDRTIVPAD